MPVNTSDLLSGGGGNFGQMAEGHLTEFDRISVGTVGTTLSPSYVWNSEISLGLYRSKASHIALSYGTLESNISSSNITVANFSASSFRATNTFNASSGISVGSSGNTGSLIPAISSMSSLVGAFIVQGSASSFTGIAWPAAKVGDVIMVSPFQSGAASSVSSGLVPWSHVTVAGQVELRLSNVSTLVQNQSAQTWVFLRVTPF